MRAASCVSAVFKLCRLCFLIAPSALFWEVVTLHLESPFPLPCAFLPWRSLDLWFYFGRGRVVIPVFCVPGFLRSSALRGHPRPRFLVCSAAVWACAMRQGRSPNRAPTCPQSLAKRFKPSKYVPVSAAAIFLVGATTLFFCLYVGFLPAVVWGGARRVCFLLSWAPYWQHRVTESIRGLIQVKETQRGGKKQ